MDTFGDLAGGGSSSSKAAVSFLQLPLPASTPSAVQQVFPPPDGQHHHHHSSRIALQQLLADPSVAAQQHSHQKDAAAAIVQGETMSPADGEDADTIKAKIMSHPQYSALLAAYLDCQKVGAPPDVSDRLSAMAAKLDAQPPGPSRWREPTTRRPDPELDQYMEAYCNMFQEEMARPIQEATEFFKSVERQLQLGSISGSEGTLLEKYVVVEEESPQELPVQPREVK